MKLKALIPLSILIFGLAGTSIYIWNKKIEQPRTMDKVSLRLQWLHQAQFAGFYVAQKKGYYRDANLDVTIRSGGAGIKALDLVAQKQDTFGTWVGDQVLSNFDKYDLHIRAIGTTFYKTLACFMVREDSPIHSAADLKGKVVGVYYGYDTETILNELLRQVGLTTNDLTLFQANYNITPFILKKVDAWPSYVINEPVDAKRQNIRVRTINPEAFGIKYYSDTIIVHDDTLRNDRDMVMRFLSATQRGWRAALSNPEDAIAATLEFDSTLKADQQREMLNAEVPFINASNPLFQMSEEVWKSMSEILQRQGALRDVSSYRKLVDFGVAQDADKKYH
jgi:NitT/TauT family transport system substrate-binding protein